MLARVISCALRDFDEVQFIWHGGETTVVPIEFYEKAIALQARFLRPGCRVRNDLQTNATRIDDKWANFFKEANFGVGVSLDGPPELHDRHRPNAAGKGSFEDVMRGIEVLKRHRVPVSALMVVDEGTLALGPDRIFDFFLERGITAFGCLDAKPQNQPNALPGIPSPTYLEPERMTRFMTRLYDRWSEHGDPKICIQEFELIRRRLGGKGRRSCTMEGNCFGRFFIVEPNGEVSHCDLFLGDPAYTVGNVLQLSFTEMAQSEKLAKLTEANDRAVDIMRERCPEFSTCMGGCPHDRYISYRHNPAHSEGCCGKYGLISHIRSRLREQEESSQLRVVA